jgi:hypothetical protein
MIDQFRQYHAVLHKLKYFLLVTEMLICLIRVCTQTLFAVASTLATIQPLLVVFMMLKEATVRESQVSQE